MSGPLDVAGDQLLSIIERIEQRDSDPPSSRAASTTSPRLREGCFYLRHWPHFFSSRSLLCRSYSTRRKAGRSAGAVPDKN
jgi:hypothetical protein